MDFISYTMRLFQRKYTGIPKSTIPNPGQVYCGLKMSRSIEMAEASTIYIAGTIG